MGETPTFIEHVKAGVWEWLLSHRGLLSWSDGDGDDDDDVDDRGDALLVFSGGRTKKDRTDLSEGESYLNLARENDFFLSSSSSPSSSPSLSQDNKRTLLQNLNDHTIAEPHATDSYQNVLFSLLQFRLKTGFYPRHITVVTHEFKRSRFLECHFPALGIYPGSTSTTSTTSITTTNVQVKIIGINPPEEITSLESLVAGEEKAGIGLWRKDLYGVGPELLAKRRRRGWTEDVERRVFLGMGLEPVVERLVCWKANGDDDDDDDNCGSSAGWFPERDMLPWNQ